MTDEKILQRILTDEQKKQLVHPLSDLSFHLNVFDKVIIGDET